jgi:O-antigen/teichoic acid export membrane protein
MFGVSSSLGMCYYDKPEQGYRNKVVSNSVFVLIVSCILMLLINLPFLKATSLFLLNSPDYATQITLVIFSTIFGMLTTPFILKLQFEEKQSKFVLNTVSTLVISILINVFCIAILKRGLSGLVESLFLSKLVTLLLFSFTGGRDIKWVWDIATQKKLVRLGAPLIPSFMALYVLQQGNMYFLKNFTSLELAGIFSIGTTFGKGISMMTFAFTTAWTPFFLSFSDKRDQASTLFGRIFTYYIFVLGFISLCFYVFAKPVIYLFTKPTYFEAYKVVGLVSTGQLLIGVFSLLLPPIYFGKKVSQLTAIQLAASLLFVGISITMTSFFGIVGAGVSFVAGYFLMDAFLFWWNHFFGNNYLRIKYEWKRTLLFSASYIAVAGITFIDLNSTSIFFQIALYSVLLTSELLLIYALLFPSEKHILMGIIKNVLTGKSRIYANNIRKST